MPDAPRRWILALDASTPRCVIAVGHITASTATMVAGETVSDTPSAASAQLVARITALMAAVPVPARALAAIACGRGPGTFTGTRVAVATAMGLAVGAGCKTVQVSTLAAVAASVRGQGTVLALLDARRDEVYAAHFEVRRPVGHPPTIERTSAETVAPLATLTRELAPGTLAVGPGVEPYASSLPLSVRASAQAIPGPTAEGLWAAAACAYAADEIVDPQALRAVYLRQSYAQMGVHPPKVPFKQSPFV